MKKRGYFVTMFALATVYALIGFVLRGDLEVIVRLIVLVGIIVTGMTLAAKSKW